MKVIFFLYLGIFLRVEAIKLGLLDRIAKDIVDRTETEDIPDEPLDDDEDEDAYTEFSGLQGRSDLPESLDLRSLGIMHRPVWQGPCGSCGVLAGTQALEARIALVSENYVPYSVQDFMNCPRKVCGGRQPYGITTYAMNTQFIVPENEIPYTRDYCTKMGTCDRQCGFTNPKKYSNALEDQFVIIAGTGSTQTEDGVIEALQDGPVTTCFNFKPTEKGERCSIGCKHANSVIGYTKDSLLMQENYGRRFGEFRNGTWFSKRGSLCSEAIINKANFPIIYYDYDRANAYYTIINGGVSENDLYFVDSRMYSITDANKRNWGTAKNKCAFIGSACKGVVALSSGKFELVSSFGEGKQGGLQAFKKVQMVIYLKNKNSGKYIGIENAGDSFVLRAVEKNQAAPFFTSYSRFISFEYPKYHMVRDSLVEIVGGVRDIDLVDVWKLNDCNLYNSVSGKSFDVIKSREAKAKKPRWRGGKNVNEGKFTYSEKWLLRGSKYDYTSKTQRFDISLSGKWTLLSRYLGFNLVRFKGEQSPVFSSSKPKQTVYGGVQHAGIKYFRWNARQIISNAGGKAIDSDIKFSPNGFNFTEKEKWFTPRDCTISRSLSQGGGDHLAMDNDNVVMSSDDGSPNSKWSFQYADL